MDGQGWFGWWAEADWVVRGVFLVLIAMSVAGWTVILQKAWQLATLHRRERDLAARLDGGADRASLENHAGPSASFLAALTAGLPDEALRVRLGHQLREVRVELESGFVVLATIGNTAPFVGLLGTVWGIMHALQGLGGETALTLAMVGGPVAEALVATAAGLFAAIPAVIGYNFLLRRLTRLMVSVEGNAHRLVDSQHRLHAHLAVLRPGEAR